MPERDERRASDRVDGLVDDVLAGRRLRPTTADAADRDAIRAAALLAGSREGYPRMLPAFRRRLAGELEKPQTRGWMTRRSALVAGVGVAFGALAGGAAERIGHLGQAVPDTSGGRLQPVTGRAFIEPVPEVARWWDAGVALADLVEGQPRGVTAGSVRAFVIRRGDTVTAMSALCTHLPCDLVWTPSSGVLHCPCHDVAFGLDGRTVSDKYPLPALPLVRSRVNNGRVEVLGTR